MVGLLLAHGLWEPRTHPQTRTQVALFKLATTATILIGVATLYLALFAATATTALLLLPVPSWPTRSATRPPSPTTSSWPG